MSGGAPIDAFGVGTSLVTSSDAPYLDAVYKLQEYARKGAPQALHGQGDLARPQAGLPHYGSDGRFARDVVTEETDVQPGEPLIEQVMGGETAPAAARHSRSRGPGRARSSHGFPPRCRTSRMRREPYPVEIAPSLRALATAVDAVTEAGPAHDRRDSLRPIAAELLARRCDPSSLGFETTAELDGPGGIVGQERAAEALSFGIGVAHEGYNVFVMGPGGSGKRTLVQGALEERARGAPQQPSDWVYVNDFAAPHRPIAIELPPGRGAALKRDMEHLVEELRAAIPSVFESEEYAHRVEQIDAQFNERHEREMGALGQDATREGIALLRTPAGFTFAPLKNGEIIEAEAFNQLPEAERTRVADLIAGFQQRLEKLVRTTLRWRKERNEQVRALNRDMILLAVGQLVEEITQRYAEFPKVIEYLGAVRGDVLENADDFRRPAEGPAAMLGFGAQAAERELRRYAVNLLVDRGGASGRRGGVRRPPDVREPAGADRAHATPRLARHRLHAGEGRRAAPRERRLPRARRAQGAHPAVRLGCPQAHADAARDPDRVDRRAVGHCRTVSLEPEPIPLAVKVVLLGERYLYYLLQALDPDFRRLFEVVADFEEVLDRTDETNGAFARMIGGLARHDGLLPFDRGRWRARSTSPPGAPGMRASCRPTSACSRGCCARPTLSRARRTAPRSRRPTSRRRSRGSALAPTGCKRRVHEAILRGTVLIDTAGARVGQVNGLSVIELGEFPFAEPTRITATTRVGDGRVIDIQREVDARRIDPLQGRDDPVAVPRRAVLRGTGRIRWPRASRSSRPTRRSTATARRSPSSARCCRRSPGCRSGSRSRSPAR